ncbi:hypothetical protein [Acidisoma silvae]|uniref:Uncharacterized protein n=1 Tax=Acidisoma silvae TaxID=2802396 RepID=A0A964DXU5_9PROT|nr:hypothetical protein [Acidisoma silvae]MCB8874427.1 hypothetical protein [Acidisoma silvae]
MQTQRNDVPSHLTHLRVPFVFVPDGAPMPQEWLAAHPGWVKFRATFRPKPWSRPAASANQPEQETVLVTDDDQRLPALQTVMRLHAPRLPREPPNLPPRLAPSTNPPTPYHSARQLIALYTHDTRALIRLWAELNHVPISKLRRQKIKDIGFTEQASERLKTDKTGSNSALIPTADDGTPGNNKTQNRQIDAICSMLRLTKDERTQLHLEISGQNLGFKEILQEARDMFNK